MSLKVFRIELERPLIQRNQESSRLSSNTAEALSRNSFFQLRSRFGRFGRKAADVLSSLQLMVQIMQKIDCIKEMGKL